MKKDQDISAQFPGLFVIHQKLRGQDIGEHQHEEHEFFLPLQGEIQISAEGKILKAGPGKMIYLPPAVVHTFRTAGEQHGERLIMIVDHKAWQQNEGGRFAPLVTSVSQLSKEILFHLLIHPETKAAKALVQTLIQTTSEMLEGAVVARHGNLAHLGGQSEDQRLHAALAVIREEFASAISTAEIARQAGLSLRNLNRLFLTELGMTPKQVTTLHRIETAKHLLKQGRHSVTDISLEVGYGSLSQFIATFRKATGQLPSDFLPN